MQTFFLNAALVSHSFLRANSSVPALSVPLLRSNDPVLPNAYVSLEGVKSGLEEAYAHTTAGKFADALAAFTTLLHSLLFVTTERSSEVFFDFNAGSRDQTDMQGVYSWIENGNQEA